MKYYTTNELLQRVDRIKVLPTQRVMGFDVVRSDTSNTIDAILGPGRRKVAFLNAHCVNVSCRSNDYKMALHRADLVLPDGIGVELAARMSNREIKENLNGTDFVPKLLMQAATQGQSLFLLGGKPGTAEAAAEYISKRIPELEIAGTCDGYHGAKHAVGKINESGADIVLVAMGVPTQELWIEENFDDLKVKTALAVGGLFDFWAGNVRRAPVPLRKARLEWAWRLAMEPRRMAGRYLIGNFAFMARAMHHALGQFDMDRIAKRGIDISLSACALLLLSPLLIGTMLAVRLESQGPAIFRQTRVGQNGKRFTLYKFRSMYIDAEARRAALLKTSDRDGVCFKSKSDPRITRIGRLLRRYSIDELPQIYNVLRGEMSLVGPRPALPEEVAAYCDHARARLHAKPGLTGLWQVSGRADIGFDQMIEMDIAYIRSRSLMLDSLLIGLTFRTVFTGRGAY